MSWQMSHGMSFTPEYKAWAMMWQRCINPKAVKYENHGGRGIAVCEEWRSFEEFFAHIGPRPDGLSLDRIDNERGYEPGNVRWATDEQQNRNRRTSKLSAQDVQEIHGRREHGEIQRTIAARFGIGRRTVGEVLSGDIWKDQVNGPTVEQPPRDHYEYIMTSPVVDQFDDDDSDVLDLGVECEEAGNLEPMILWPGTPALRLYRNAPAEGVSP